MMEIKPNVFDKSKNSPRALQRGQEDGSEHEAKEIEIEPVSVLSDPDFDLMTL